MRVCVKLLLKLSIVLVPPAVPPISRALNICAVAGGHLLPSCEAQQLRQGNGAIDRRARVIYRTVGQVLGSEVRGGSDRCRGGEKIVRGKE